MRTDQYIERIGRFLASRNITQWHIETNRKHRTLVVVHHGRTIRLSIAMTGSDHRGPRNAIADLKRALTSVDTDRDHVDHGQSRGVTGHV